ncbi:MAG: hypothetical protein LBL13_11665 [Bacteroidales bacterium]|jgi:hypothetical protein|nr:hypothetical protein [Bacteroidales bacterium]
MGDLTAFVLTIFVLIPVGITLLICCCFCAEAASDKGRNGAGWFFAAFFGSSILAAVLLIALGDTQRKREQKILRDEELREFVRRRNTHQASTPERNSHQDEYITPNQQSTDESRSFNPYAKTIGDMYKR